MAVLKRPLKSNELQVTTCKKIKMSFFMPSDRKFSKLNIATNFPATASWVFEKATVVGI